MCKTFRKLFKVGMEHDDGYSDAHTIRDPAPLPIYHTVHTVLYTVGIPHCDTICHPNVVTHRP